ncbi:hypothetical protein [Agrobacterium tumefaciens]|uniref:hypothetical protein n=1 Tax=Agrobacterium tumefaciens TaxID=358 RepID=UPI000DD740A7|nr:hypothetical protein [Agrobacterium tumefaciens]UXS27046.1 hypothetical protein FY153_21555 [Agrobacterium tumefaciens]UXS54455.1 hypothetical protein FY148_17215 [Agrobacterium tumefaciens]UXS65571.1 hypothetical protein FY147_21980 [Agrobacterium tumefaciens]UXT99155.1 hypothetical protein FY129_16680 [Agrobacterium tumefaciens]
MVTRLDRKLANIRAGRYKPTDFIIADAKDSDVGAGVSATGFDYSVKPPRRRTRQEFITQIEEIIDQDVVDIMLVSQSNLDLLDERGAFSGSEVKPAIRGNLESMCWGGVRHGTYTQSPSVPFRDTGLARAIANYPTSGTDLCLYSVCFTNDLDRDICTLKAFAEFRAEASKHNFKYFYEVFNPNVDIGLTREQTGEFVNDHIIKSLASVPRAERPLFLKMPYNGPKALEELASFDSELIVGVLGGGAGTTRDTFELVAQSERYGARLALFGRKINLAEAPLNLIVLMRAVADGALKPEEAVRAYHGELQTLGLPPVRPLADDRVITEDVLKAAAAKAA